MRRAQERLEREAREEGTLAVEDTRDAVVPVEAEAPVEPQRDETTGSVEVQTETPAALAPVSEVDERAVEELVEGIQDLAIDSGSRTQLTPSSRPPLQQPVTPSVPKSFAPESPAPRQLTASAQQDQSVPRAITNGGVPSSVGSGGRSVAGMSQQNTPMQPLFDQQQLMRLQELAVPKGTLLYPAFGPGSMAFNQVQPTAPMMQLQRPVFLDREEMRVPMQAQQVQRPLFLEGENDAATDGRPAVVPVAVHYDPGAISGETSELRMLV